MVVEEAKRAVEAGASAGLVVCRTAGCVSRLPVGRPARPLPAPSTKRSGLLPILFQYPDATKATYNLETQLEIATATRRLCDEKRRAQYAVAGTLKFRSSVASGSNPQILTCHDEYLLHTMFDVDGSPACATAAWPPSRSSN